MGRIMAPNFSLEAGRDVPTQLREKGLSAADIEVVILTHLHLDHASAISEFPEAAFVVSDAEWEAATTGSRPLLRGYRPKHYDFAFDYRTVDFDGDEIDSYGPFGRTFDLFGDGSIRLVFTPGHTAGHMSVAAAASAARLRHHRRRRLHLAAARRAGRSPTAWRTATTGVARCARRRPTARRIRTP